MRFKTSVFTLLPLLMSFFPNISNAQNCSCLTFFDPKPKPSWISGEKITEAYYSTYGSSYCTGLQKVDTQRSDKSAKANLSRMIQAQIKSTQNIKQGNSGNGVLYSHLTENTIISTDLILGGSLIHDRWVDPKTCTIYSATRIGTSDVDNALIDQQSKEASKLTNQFYSISKSKYSIVSPRIETALSDIRVRFNSGKNSLVIKSRVFDINEKPGRLVNLIIEIEIFDPTTSQSIWKKAYPGKGLSFKDTSKSILVDKALTNAMKTAMKELQMFILENNR
jgi:hypothetical protein